MPAGSFKFIALSPTQKTIVLIIITQIIGLQIRGRAWS